MNISVINASKYVLIFTMTLLMALYSQRMFANPACKTIIDVYGTQKINAEDVYNRYGDDFRKLTDLLRSGHTTLDEKDSQIMRNLMMKINQELHELGDFAYIDTGPVLYYKNDNVYYTIDVVEKKDIQRLNGLSPVPTQSFVDPDGLIKSWREYENLGLQKFMLNDDPINTSNCPVTHCTSGFVAPEYKKYKDLFVHGVLKNKSQLIDILYKDKDVEKREISAFLLGNLIDYKEVIQILIPAMHDSNQRVRNNVMRVLGVALEKDKNVTFPIQDAIAALDYPSVTDRNKADYILLSLSSQPRYAKFIRDNAGHLLISQLKAQQPFIHGGAYKILTNISGKTYGERDYSAWQSWLNSKSI